MHLGTESTLQVYLISSNTVPCYEESEGKQTHHWDFCLPEFDQALFVPFAGELELSHNFPER